MKGEEWQSDRLPIVMHSEDDYMFVKTCVQISAYPT